MAKVFETVEALAMDLQQWTNAQVRGVAVTLANELYENTPVDSGFARSNWVVSFGAPNTSIVGSKEAVDNSRFHTSVGALLNSTSFDALMFASNGVPYMGRLNDGWSAQAPAGFIEAAIDRALQIGEQGY